MNKKHIPLIIGVLIPILMIIVVAFSVLIPQQELALETDFLYTLEDYTSCVRYSYYVETSMLVQEDSKIDPEYCRGDRNVSQKLYLYDASEGVAREISFEDAQAFSYDDNFKSADGYRINTNYHSSGIFFDLFGGGSYEQGFYIEKDGHTRKIQVDHDSYNSSLRFIGWVMNN